MVNDVVAIIHCKQRKKVLITTSNKRYHVMVQGCSKKIIFNDLLILFLIYFRG